MPEDNNNEVSTRLRELLVRTLETASRLLSVEAPNHLVVPVAAWEATEGNVTRRTEILATRRGDTIGWSLNVSRNVHYEPGSPEYEARQAESVQELQRLVSGEWDGADSEQARRGRLREEAAHEWQANPTVDLALLEQVIYLAIMEAADRFRDLHTTETREDAAAEILLLKEEVSILRDVYHSRDDWTRADALALVAIIVAIITALEGLRGH